MQKDLDRFRKRKRRRHRLTAVLLLSIIAALLVAGVRSCSDRYQEPYNKEYRPMDVEQQHVVRPKN
jgi:predicted nucleic acid-binding Zn ribbon protein